MSEKKCEVEYTTIENDDGREVDSVIVSCNECGAHTEAFGQSEGSIKSCLSRMRDECECEDGLKAYFVCDELED